MGKTDHSTGRHGDNGTFAWRDLKPQQRAYYRSVPRTKGALGGDGSMSRRTYERVGPTQGPNYRFFQGVAVAWAIVAVVVYVCYLVARWL